jgi:hypothetical protein
MLLGAVAALLQAYWHERERERERGARESESERYSEFVQLLHNRRVFFFSCYACVTAHALMHAISGSASLSAMHATLRMHSCMQSRMH